MGCFKGFNCFKRRDSEDEGEDVTPPEEDLTHYKRINPVVK